MSAVQFLSQGQVEGATGLPVTAIDKNVGLGLQWAEIGLFYRLPGYVSIEQYILTAHLLGVKVVALDQVYLAQAEQIIPGSAAAIVAQLQMMGITVTGYTVDQDEQWLFLESLGVDGIFTNDIPRGVSLQKRL
jgi:glycerophosphoryl diester phosphodiesterase